MNRHLACTLTLFIVALCACAPAATPTRALTPVTVQLRWTHNAQFAGMYAAEQKGYYASEGLTAKFVEGGPNWETVQRVQSCAPNTPIVVLTGRDDEELALEAMRHGAQDYLVKGQIESNLLTHSIRYAIERKRVGLALQASEARYRLLAENATDVIWTVDLNMQITYVSPSVTRLLGFAIEEAMARMMQQAYTPATFEKATQMFAEEMALEQAGHGDPKRSRTLELELYRKDGGTVPVEANFGFLRDATGQPTGILAIVRDITERKHVEDALRALSLTDDLTGLYNRRGFLMLAEQQFRIAKRAQRALLVLFADIDGLKRSMIRGVTRKATAP